MTKPANTAQNPLNLETLDDLELSHLHRQIAEVVLEITRAYVSAGILATITTDPGVGHEIRIVSDKPDTCPLAVYLYCHQWTDTGSGTIGFGAGAEAYFNIPEDPPPYPAPDSVIVRIVKNAAESVLEGNLEEELHFRDETVVRSIFKLPTKDGPIGIDRSKLGYRLRGMFKKKHIKRVVYAPY